MTNKIELLQISVRVWPDDYEYLKATSGFKGTNQIIRQIIHNYVLHARDTENAEISRLKKANLRPLNIDPRKFTKPPEKPEPETIDVDY